MILAATCSIEETAALLALPRDAVREAVRGGVLQASPLGDGCSRIGWRSIAAELERLHAEAPALLQAALADLRDLRAARLAVSRAGDPPRLLRLDAPIADEPEQPPPLPADAERLALLREAARAAGGGEALSCAAFDRWATRNYLPVSAAAFCAAHGSWNAAKRAAGVAVRAPRRPVAVSNEQLLALLREAAARPGCEALTLAQFDAYCAEIGSVASAALVASRFRSWNAGKAAAGLQLRPRGYHGHRRDIGAGNRNRRRYRPQRR